jgi:hypothetical protein
MSPSSRVALHVAGDRRPHRVQNHLPGIRGQGRQGLDQPDQIGVRNAVPCRPRCAWRCAPLRKRGFRGLYGDMFESPWGCREDSARFGKHRKTCRNSRSRKGLRGCFTLRSPLVFPVLSGAAGRVRTAPLLHHVQVFTSRYRRDVTPSVASPGAAPAPRRSTTCLRTVPARRRAPRGRGALGCCCRRAGAGRMWG